MAEITTGGGKASGTTVEYKTSDAKLVDRMRKLIASNPAHWTQREIGAQVGSFCDKKDNYSGSYVSTWLHGRFTGNEFEPAVVKFLDIVNEDLRAAHAAEFLVDNTVTTEVRYRLDRALKLGITTALTGDPGIGKTTSLGRFMRDKAGLVFRIQASPRRNRAADIERTLIDIIGEQDEIFKTAGNRSDCIVRYLIRFQRMIVIEDFDLLHRSAYEFLLRDVWNQLYDRGRGLPIVMFGNVEGIAKLRKLPRQISGRIQHLHLKIDKAFTPKFVQRFMQHHLDDIDVTPEMAKIGHELANDSTHAHLRTLKDFCIEAREMVDKDEGDATEVFQYLYDESLNPRAIVEGGMGRAVGSGQGTVGRGQLGTGTQKLIGVPTRGLVAA